MPYIVYIIIAAACIGMHLFFKKGLEIPHRGRFNSYAEKHHIWDDSPNPFSDNKNKNYSESVSKLEDISPISPTTDNLSEEEMDLRESLAKPNRVKTLNYPFEDK